MMEVHCLRLSYDLSTEPRLVYNRSSHGEGTMLHSGQKILRGNLQGKACAWICTGSNQRIIHQLAKALCIPTSHACRNTSQQPSF